jgi:hypothetical protein
MQSTDIPDEMINATDESKSVISLSDKNIPDQFRILILKDLKKMNKEHISLRTLARGIVGSARSMGIVVYNPKEEK